MKSTKEGYFTGDWTGSVKRDLAAALRKQQDLTLLTHFPVYEKERFSDDEKAIFESCGDHEVILIYRSVDWLVVKSIDSQTRVIMMINRNTKTVEVCEDDQGAYTHCSLCGHGFYMDTRDGSHVCPDCR
jgi:hypothetical protein